MIEMEHNDNIELDVAKVQFLATQVINTSSIMCFEWGVVGLIALLLLKVFIFVLCPSSTKLFWLGASVIFIMSCALIISECFI